jgi:NAD(P)-dependent dehydrogenase (short-subunit alcohol dehydrogenase family)
MTEFENKAVFVTSGAYGLGRAVVSAFAQAGARVGFVDIMSKLITSAFIATVLLTGAGNAQPSEGDGPGDHREYLCKVLQRNCS